MGQAQVKLPNEPGRRIVIEVQAQSKILMRIVYMLEKAVTAIRNANPNVIHLGFVQGLSTGEMHQIADTLVPGGEVTLAQLYLLQELGVYPYGDVVRLRKEVEAAIALVEKKYDVS